MYDVYLQILSYVSSIWRRRWYVIGIAWAVCVGGWIFVANLPDRYESSARIYVDADSMLGPLMRGMTVEMNLFQQIDIMQRTLFSRPNLEKVVLMTDLDLTVDTAADKEELLAKIRSSVRLRQQGRNLFQVSYSDNDPELTKKVVSAVLSIFVESNLGASRNDMDSTRRFLRDKVLEYERQLQEAEARLAAFKKKNMGFLPGGGNYYSHMQKVRADLAQTQGFLDQARTAGETLTKQLAEVPQFIEVADPNANFALTSGGGGGPSSDTALRILEMEKLVDNLLTRYTAKHPDVVNAEKRLATLRAELAEEQRAFAPPQETADAAPGAGPAATETANSGTAPGTTPGTTKALNPVYEQIKMRMVQHETVLATLQQREAAQRKEVEKWEGMAQQVPLVEAELSRLNRDYSIVKRNYEQLRSRQETANMARDLETKANKIQFRIIDPPRVPVVPSGPNRPLFLTIVLVVGFGAGVAFAFVLGQINNTFFSMESLRKTFAVPVLGSVSAIQVRGVRRRRLREAVTFAIVLAGLVATYGGLLTVEVLGTA